MAKLNEPFVIFAEAVDVNGRHYEIPMGVELARSKQCAHKQAKLRWPNLFLFQPKLWESVPQKVRVAALEADRRMSPTEREVWLDLID